MPMKGTENNILIAFIRMILVFGGGGAQWRRRRRYRQRWREGNRLQFDRNHLIN